MCGRYGLFAELDTLAEQFDFDSAMMENVYTPRWNIPPTTPVLTVQSAGANTEGIYRPNTASLLRWGMTGARNPKSKGSGRPLFNARAETVHELPSFRRSFRERRCLIPANGFYEWRKDASGNRTPVWFHREDDAPLAFAGIWRSERMADGDIHACAIITCAANDLAAPIHHRMPVILPPADYEEWLSADSEPSDLLALLQPYEWREMAYHTVSSEVNRAANNYPALTARAVQEAQIGFAGI